MSGFEPGGWQPETGQPPRWLWPTLLFGLLAATGLAIGLGIGLPRMGERTTTVTVTATAGMAFACHMHATYKNNGGPGSGIATLWVTASKDTADDVNQQLASCTVAIPQLPADGAASVDCTAASSELEKFFRQHPSGLVYSGANAH